VWKLSEKNSDFSIGNLSSFCFLYIFLKWFLFLYIVLVFKIFSAIVLVAVKLPFHLLRHKDNCELLCPIWCRQQDCRSTYTTVFNLIRHINTHHTVNISQQGSDPCTSSGSDNAPFCLPCAECVIGYEDNTE